MNQHEEVIQSIFLENNGQIDLLTGALAPDQFDQIAKRDLALADRNSSEVTIISVVLKLQNYLPAENAIELIAVKSEIENELAKLYFELKNIFRQTDCISRVSKLGFWILLANSNESITKQLIQRATRSLPEFVNVSACQRESGETLLNWYKRIDKIHFSDKQ
jgi:GGDEF domain-containing protein